MTSQIKVKVNGKEVQVASGNLVTTAVIKAGSLSHRKSITGEPRGPLCGMGVCFECRVTINRFQYVRACQTICEEGMEIQTDE